MAFNNKVLVLLVLQIKKKSDFFKFSTSYGIQKDLLVKHFLEEYGDITEIGFPSI